MNLRNTCPDQIKTKKEMYIMRKEEYILGWLRFFCIVALLLQLKAPLNNCNTKHFNSYVSAYVRCSA